MKQLSYFLLLLTTLVSCSKTSVPKGNVTVKGTIKGLKIGTIYLQKLKDSALINVDSITVDGNSDFVLYSQISEPEIHYLYLDKNDGAKFNDRVPFFAEKGEVRITTTVQDFEKDFHVRGGKNAMKLQEYKKMIKGFNDRDLKIMKENFEASKQNDTSRILKNKEKSNTLLINRYRYTINFAMLHKNLEISPYVIMQQAFDANIKYLDSVANSLSPRVRNSIYGKQLLKHLEDRKLKQKS